MIRLALALVTAGAVIWLATDGEVLRAPELRDAARRAGELAVDWSSDATRAVATAATQPEPAPAAPAEPAFAAPAGPVPGPVSTAEKAERPKPRRPAGKGLPAQHAVAARAPLRDLEAAAAPADAEPVSGEAPVVVLPPLDPEAARAIHVRLDRVMDLAAGRTP